MTIWVIVISAAAVLVVIAVWLLLRDASPQPLVSIADPDARDGVTRATSTDTGRG